MKRPEIRWLMPLAAALLGIALVPRPTESACCYFSAKDKDILQPGQKVFISWDPMEKVESWTVQPKFEGNAQDFGMVIPTPSQPKLDEMPRDFFKELALYSLLKKREQPASKLLPVPSFRKRKTALDGFSRGDLPAAAEVLLDPMAVPESPPDGRPELQLPAPDDLAAHREGALAPVDDEGEPLQDDREAARLARSRRRSPDQRHHHRAAPRAALHRAPRSTHGGMGRTALR